MKRAVALIAIALGACACASETTPQGGIANYDALRQASDACTAKGGTMRLKSGGAAEYIGDYTCKRN